ncbi:MAG: hypothetical protein HQL13_08700, partial [Candidatus Omnitrophica bacterium]|nr:hypothetical protein [Candidatus Omnitrophota bacterium]
MGSTIKLRVFGQGFDPKDTSWDKWLSVPMQRFGFSRTGQVLLFEQGHGSVFDEHGRYTKPNDFSAVARGGTLVITAAGGLTALPGNMPAENPNPPTSSGLQAEDLLVLTGTLSDVYHDVRRSGAATYIALGSGGQQPLYEDYSNKTVVDNVPGHMGLIRGADGSEVVGL